MEIVNEAYENGDQPAVGEEVVVRWLMGGRRMRLIGKEKRVCSGEKVKTPSPPALANYIGPQG